MGKLENIKATKQPSGKRPSPISGCPPPDGFEKYPERRHNGAWKKEETLRYKLEQLIKKPEEELKKLAVDKSMSLAERKLAICIIRGDWKILEGMMNQAYGMPKQSVETLDLTPPKPLSPRKAKNDKSSSK